ncbi:MAG: DUF2341 domain-containing protein [Patescibacteria group bacterium]|nr:DUF2341 domain-containing protein [Patescibacteria group bacterium]
MRNQLAFTLIELILVVAITALIAAAIFVIINPGRRIGEANNAIRSSEASNLKRAVDYTIASAGQIPATLQSLNESQEYMLVLAGESTAGTIYCPTLAKYIAKVDIANVIANYMSVLPIDPIYPASSTTTGYYIYKRGSIFEAGHCEIYGDITYANNYNFRRTITIDNNQVSGSSNMNNFPLLFAGTYDYLATYDNGGWVLNEDGYDIIFTTDAAGKNKLAHEVESYNPATGQVAIWVKIPTLYYNSDTDIYLFYGNPDINSSQEDIATVWDENYQAVWHFAETSGQHYDSSSNNIHSQGVNVLTQGSVVSKINGADYYNNSTSYVDFGDVLELDFPVTISAWVYKDQASNTDPVIFSNHSGSLYTGYWMTITSGNLLEIGFGDGNGNGSSNRYGRVSQNTIPVDNWTYLTGTLDGTSLSDINVYINGTLNNGSGTGSATTYHSANDATFRVGYRNHSNSSNRMGGIIDEVRISNSIRNASWIATEYNNQNNPSAFYSVSD